MKQKEKAVYTKRITIRLREAEFIQLDAQFKETTCRKFSDYLRRIMLAKPITTMVKKILNTGMDQIAFGDDVAAQGTLPFHDNIRGPEDYK